MYGFKFIHISSIKFINTKEKYQSLLIFLINKQINIKTNKKILRLINKILHRKIDNVLVLQNPTDIFGNFPRKRGSYK